ncbi:MAG: GNAT family N-acetyltransferase [Calditrichaeota bacterium]|nr:MAG: GNAT family N-acetyltransferase [Calditrichota bacterium]
MNFEVEEIQFENVSDNTIFDSLKTEWRKSLTAPQDDMWETFTEFAEHWKINFKNQTIGYACVNSDNCLLQFFLIPEWIQTGSSIFEKFAHQLKIQKAIIGTNNPHCLSMAMNFQESVEIQFYLFSDYLNEKVGDKEGTLRLVKIDELEKFVEFCHISTGGPKDWLSGYVSNLITKGEYFVFEEKGEILGICEVRKSETNPKVANLGMIVSPNHRKKGLGTFLLGKAKEISLEWKREPICGCEKENIGSLKAIHKNGFRSIHQMLLLKFGSQ